MSQVLPDRPDLDQLRRQAKDLRDAVRQGDANAVERFARHHPSAAESAPDAVSLAAAQFVIARESGFTSWPKLKAAIDADVMSRQAVSAFVTASIDARGLRARDMLAADPEIARRSLLAATVLGEVAVVREMLSADAAAALAIDGERGWPPLLYACYSRWHLIDPDRTPGVVEVVRLLLQAGASPNTNDGGQRRYRSALKGSVEVENPAVTEVLLDAGADPNPGQPIGEAIGQADHRCLQLLLAHGARVARTWSVGSAVWHDDPVAMSMLLEHLEVTGAGAAREATEALPEAAATASLPVVGALLDAGADPQAVGEDGFSALRLAVRAGRNDNAERLRAAGARDDITDIDRFLGACLNADRQTAEQLLAEHAGLRGRLSDRDEAVVIEAAESRTPEALALMLALGFPHDARNHTGEQPLHGAAYHGRTAAVRLLLEAGADIDAHDDRYDGTPLGFATVGSGEAAKPGDWIGTVRLLIEAGADRQGVWVSQKPPSEEVAELLRGYGVGPDELTEDQPDDKMEEPGSIGTGVMAELAAHLEAAYQDRDLDLLASLLHPEVTWTGLCTSRSQVIDWYRNLYADGVTAAVHSVEVDRDAVMLGLAVANRAVGARPAPPQQLYQVFTIEDAQITEIRAYPDRHSALTRT